MTRIGIDDVQRLIPKFECTDIPYCDTSGLVKTLGTQMSSTPSEMLDSETIYRMLAYQIQSKNPPPAKNHGSVVCLCVCTCQYMDRTNHVPKWVTYRLGKKKHQPIETLSGFVGWLITHGIKRDGLQPIKKQDRLQMNECIMSQIDWYTQQKVESLLEQEGILVRSRTMSPPKVSSDQCEKRTDTILKYRIDTWRIMESRYSFNEIDRIDEEVRNRDEPPTLGDRNDIGVYIIRTCRYIIMNEQIPAWIANKRGKKTTSASSVQIDISIDENTTYPRLLYGIITRIICKIAKHNNWKLAGQLMFWLSGAICDQCTIQDHRHIVSVIPSHLQAELLGKMPKLRSKTVQSQGYWN